MDDDVELIDMFSGVATSGDSNGVTMKLPRGCHIITTTRYMIRPFPLCGVKVLHPAQNGLTRPPDTVTAKTNGMYPGYLAHAVSGVLCSVVANPRQPNRHIHRLACG